MYYYTKSKKSSIFYLLIVFATYLLYFFADMQTSANVVVKQTESRGKVHYFLFLLIALLLVYFVTHLKVVPQLGMNMPLFFIALWIPLVDIITGSSFWNMAVRTGLIALWFLISFFAAKYVDSEKKYNTILFFEFVIFIFTLYFAFVAYNNYRNYADGKSTNVLNVSYNVLVLLPFMMQLKNKLLRTGAVLVGSFFVILSMKRGAIIALVAMLLAYFIATQCMSSNYKEKKKAIKNLILITSFMIIILCVVDRYTGGYLSSRFSKSSLMDGSNRSVLYSMAIQDISHRSFFDFVIGKGSTSVLKIIGSGVHCEPLEFLFSYGLIGLLLYLYFLYRGLRRCVWLIKNKSKFAPYYAMLIAYIIVVGLVGTALFSHSCFHMMLLLGICGKYYKSENRIESN